MRRSIALLLGAALVVAGCGRDPEPATVAPEVSDATDPVAGTGSVTVTETTATVSNDTVASAGQPADDPPTTTPVIAPSTEPPVRPALTVEARGQTGRSDPAPGEVLLWVSNQSFEDDSVSVTITVDGQPAVADEFKVESQHNWVGFYLRGLAPGEHQVSARSDTGVELDGSFTLPADAPRWLVLDYWFYRDGPEGRRFTFEEFDHAVMFM